MIELLYFAAGGGSRFPGGSKLLAPYRGKPLYRCCLDRLLTLAGEGFALTVAARDARILQDLSALPVRAVFCPEAEKGKSYSVRAALEAAGPGTEGYVFINADQPELKAQTVLGLTAAWRASGKGMGCVRYGGEPGNPCIFSGKYFDALMALTGDLGGKAVMKSRPADICYFEVADKRELMDADTPEALRALEDGTA